MEGSDREAIVADHERFKNLTFEGFRVLATTAGLTRYQQIGFPESYRHGHEQAIFADIERKLPQLGGSGKVVLDIGPGCSQLPRLLIDRAQRNNHQLLLCDSPEMLGHLPDARGMLKVPGRYPQEVASLFREYHSKVDVILCYSVLHYIFAEQPLFEFLDRTLSLLAPGGACLLGDIPNITKRKRFFSSEAGICCHQDFTSSCQLPHVEFNCLETGKIDDSVVIALLSRCRAAGFDSFLLPQGPELPLANRREDILIQRP